MNHQGSTNYLRKSQRVQTRLTFVASTQKPSSIAVRWECLARKSSPIAARHIKSLTSTGAKSSSKTTRSPTLLARSRLKILRHKVGASTIVHRTFQRCTGTILSRSQQTISTALDSHSTLQYLPLQV